MKLIIAIVDDHDYMCLRDAVVEAGFSSTKLASTGGFFLRGNTTLLIGVKDHEVADVLDIIKNTCQKRTKIVPPPSEVAEIYSEPLEVEAGGCIVFVLPVDEFYTF